MKKSPIERFLSLTEAQKQAEIARFARDDANGKLPGKPLTPAQRKQWARIRRNAKRGRPKLGRGAKMVPVSIERGLLEEADAFAKAHQLKRSQMFAEGLRLVMGRA